MCINIKLHCSTSETESKKCILHNYSFHSDGSDVNLHTIQLSSSHVMCITFVPFQSLQRTLYFANMIDLLVIITCSGKFCSTKVHGRGQFKHRRITGK